MGGDEEGSHEACHEGSCPSEGHEEEGHLSKDCRSPSFRREINKTKGGLTASSLTKNRTGRIVSKKKSALGKKNTWMIAVQKARKALKIKGFVAVKKGSELYKKAKEFQ